MDAIEVLMNEHKNIKKVLSAIKKDCEEMVEGKEVDVKFYRNVVDFVRSYADKYHHQKEEKKLFNVMGEVDENIKRGPVMGMILEHDLGRGYMGNLEIALDDYEKGDKKQKAYIIANALCYATMLEKHIEKEDTAIYMMAKRMLSEDIQKELSREFEEVEKDETNTKIREKYLSFAESL